MTLLSFLSSTPLRFKLKQSSHLFLQYKHVFAEPQGTALGHLKLTNTTIESYHQSEIEFSSQLVVCEQLRFVRD